MSVPKVKGLTPCGSQVLVELLNTEEILGTKLELVSVKGAPDAKSFDGAPQAYIIGMGPKVTTEDWGFKVGDRIIFSGQFVPAPNYDKYTRARGTIDPHSVKAVLAEE